MTEMIDPRSVPPPATGSKQARRRSLPMRVLRWLVRAVLVFVGCIAAYVAAGYLLSLVRINGDFRPAEQGIEVAVWASGVHADVVLPARTPAIDWIEWIGMDGFRGPRADLVRATHVAFGWGDRGFYLQTRTWDQLRLSVALTAISGLGSTLMHVEYIGDPKGLPEIRSVRVSESQYRQLVAFIKGSFQVDAAGRPIAIPDVGYDDQDGFFPAVGRYSLFRTCNVWTCDAIAAAGLPAPLWSPFMGGVTRHLPR